MSNKSTLQDCPYCKEEIKADAIKCKYCGSSVVSEKPSHEGICPYCKEPISPQAIKCKHCKSELLNNQRSHCGCRQPEFSTAIDLGGGNVLPDPRRPRICYWRLICL